jgi:lipoprotein-anchoring transpeptidase ErfK/SrfK
MRAASITGVATPRLVAGAMSAMALAVACIPAAPAVASPTPASTTVPSSQSLVVVLHDRVARAAPSVHARRIGTVAARRPLTGVRTVLPVTGSARSVDGQAWVHVRLPGRPNGHEGWIPNNHTRRTATEWRITVSLSNRLVTVFHGRETIRRFHAIVGKPSTPTPRGTFFIEEALALAPGAPGGPYALATSARSNVLQEFGGGPGQIALHGTNNLAGALGTAASHGCVRLSSRAVIWLAHHIGSGTPLVVSD